jgi:hypothetical protein
MADSKTKPRRRVQISLEIGADSWDHLAASIHCIADDIDRQGKLPPWSVSGGYSSGWHYTVSEDESITHESWAKANDAYVKEIRPDKPVTPSTEPQAPTPKLKNALGEGERMEGIEK